MVRPIIMEVENGSLQDDRLLYNFGSFSTSMIMGGRVVIVSGSS